MQTDLLAGAAGWLSPDQCAGCATALLPVLLGAVVLVTTHKEPEIGAPSRESFLLMGLGIGMVLLNSVQYMYY